MYLLSCRISFRSFQGSSPFIVAGLACFPAWQLVLCFLLFPGKCWMIWSEEANFAGLILSLIGLASIDTTHRTTLPVGVLIACHVNAVIIGLSYSNMMTTGMNALNEKNYKETGTQYTIPCSSFLALKLLPLVAVITSIYVPASYFP